MRGNHASGLRALGLFAFLDQTGKETGPEHIHVTALRIASETRPPRKEAPARSFRPSGHTGKTHLYLVTSLRGCVVTGNLTR